MYFRISKEDEMIADESNSITNQREQVKRHIRSHKELKIYECVELSDDGFSGTNMNRPGMQKLLEMVKLQQVGCIVVKDFSRFARDYLEVGKYIEQIFQFMGIRFVSINDNYDSNNFVGGIAEIDVPFQNLMYDFYAKDLSEKVRTSLTAIKYNGKYVANHAPYGYLKDPKDHHHHHLIIDESVVKIVKRIFREYLNGLSMYLIAQNLNAEKIASPAVHAYELNANAGFAAISEVTIWTSTAISRILENETYTGAIIYNKFKNRIIGDKRSHSLPREEWKKIENCHKAIISKEDYMMVNEKKKANARIISKHPRHCLSGKVYCENCGKALVHQMPGRPKYHCNTRNYVKTVTGCVVSIRDEDLESVILKSLQMQMNLFVDGKQVREAQETKKLEKLQLAEKHLLDMHKTLEKLNTDVREGYEVYKSGLTDKETYMQQKKKMYDELLEKIEENIGKQEVAVNCIADEDMRSAGGMSFEEGSFNLTKLTKEMIDTFVRKVVVTDDHRIEIVWNFRDTI